MMTMDQLVAPSGLDMLPGYGDPVDASQRVFRGLLDALSRPGTIVRLTPPPDFPTPLVPAAAAIGLSLLDFETRVFLPQGCVGAGAWLRFHTGCRLERTAAEADFVIVPPGCVCPDLTTLRIGSDEAPHLSAILVLSASRLEAGSGQRLTGPGIDGETRLTIEGIPPNLLAQREALATAFPRGIDVVLTCGERIAALPRTTRLED
ncbi:MAG: phosphonate C-P lyase system protein PhnH [Rhodospirillales bacterium]|jgi:alpha-D-ribose 1-methylphosphonate 5-triphosphate synthase subunit PhnH